MKNHVEGCCQYWSAVMGGGGVVIYSCRSCLPGRANNGKHGHMHLCISVRRGRQAECTSLQVHGYIQQHYIHHAVLPRHVPYARVAVAANIFDYGWHRPATLIESYQSTPPLQPDLLSTTRADLDNRYPTAHRVSMKVQMAETGTQQSHALQQDTAGIKGGLS